MQYTVAHYIFFFFVYSFLGWIFEEIYAAFQYGKFVNRGFINGPLCLKYGVSMVVIINDMKDLASSPVYQFLITFVLVVVIEYISGWILHRVTGRRFWNYSDKRWNLNGYISAQSSILLACLAAVNLWLVHPFVYIMFELVPLNIMKIILIVSIITFLIDLFMTLASSLEWKIKGNIYETIVERLEKTKTNMGLYLFTKIQQRMYKAFPEFIEQEKKSEDGFGVPKNRVFAEGLCLDKLVWVFLISAFLGDLIETVYVWWTAGVLMSRSSLLYGMFSVVWGLGSVIITVLLYSLRERNDRFVFLGGFFLGGVYEYSCSVFTEVVFGTTFWDYSHLPFNINGRVNLLFCFFWGVAAIIWMKLVYPFISKLIEKIPPVAGKIMTYIIILLMAMDILVSGLAIERYVRRQAGAATQTEIGTFLDQAYQDSFIEKIYPDMKIKAGN